MILHDYFSGIGGFARGCRQAGIEFEKHYYSEIDEHAIAIYKHNNPEAEYVGSITDESLWNTERPNIICFGSPCQDFSIAGTRKGMGGERSSLISYAIDSITRRRPDVFIWENVKGVFSSNDGADFWAVIKAFADIGGYRLEWQLLNSSWFLPQNRERIYLVGYSGEGCGREVFPLREGHSRTDEGAEQTPIVGCLTAGGSLGGMHSSMTLIQSGFGGKSFSMQENPKNANCLQARDYKDAKTNAICIGSNQPNAAVMQEKSPALHASMAHNNGPYVIEEVVPVLTPDRPIKRQNGRRFKEPGEDSFTLTAQDKHGVMEDKKIRRLTEIECERLQGFKDNYTEYGNYDGEVKKVSATQRYKCLGNAVTVNVVEAVMRSVIEAKLL